MGTWLTELGTCYSVMMQFFRPRSGARRETPTQRRFNRPASVRNARGSKRLVGQPSASGPVRRGPQCERRFDQRHAWRTPFVAGRSSPASERTQLALFSALLASAVSDRSTHRGGAGTCSAEARSPALSGRRRCSRSGRKSAVKHRRCAISCCRRGRHAFCSMRPTITWVRPSPKASRRSPTTMPMILCGNQVQAGCIHCHKDTDSSFVRRPRGDR
jgi:hypothetical protein